MKKFPGSALLVLGILATASPAPAQSFPDRPIRVIVPYGPGGVDIQMRLAAPFMEQQLGQSIVVENRAGAGAVIGTTQVRNAAADGYTLLYTGTAALSVIPHMRPVSYTVQDFAPIGNITATALVVVARADAPFKTIEEMIAYAKANPAKINVGSSGTGTTTHLVAEAFQLAAGIKLTHVPFTGLGAVAAAMMSGTVDMVIGVPDSFIPLIDAGKLRALATTGRERSEFLPKVPTLREIHLDVVEETKFGLLAPAGTPKPVIDKLAQALKSAVVNEKFTETLRKNYTTAFYLSPADFAEAIGKENVYWGDMFKRPELAVLIQK